MKEKCLSVLSNWVEPVKAISQIPIDDFPSYKNWRGTPSITLSNEEVKSIKDAIQKAKTAVSINLKGAEGAQLLADLDGIIEDGESTSWKISGDLGAVRVDDTIHDVVMSVVEDLAESIVRCECRR